MIMYRHNDAKRYIYDPSSFKSKTSLLNRVISNYYHDPRKGPLTTNYPLEEVFSTLRVINLRQNIFQEASLSTHTYILINEDDVTFSANYSSPKINITLL